MKRILTVIAFVLFGLAVVQAQTPAVPMPSTPTFTPIPGTSSEPRLNLTQQQWQRMFVIRDQKKYAEYLLNTGNITRDEYYARENNLIKEENEIVEPLLRAMGDYNFQMAYIFTNGDLQEAIKKLWPDNWPPGWHGQELRELIGFALQQPQGTRAMSFNEYNQMIRMNLTPLTDQVFNNIKQQLETGLRATMTNEGSNRYTYVLRSNRSANGKPYFIEVSRRSDGYVYIEVSELRRDP